jgi:hypothetical protein
MTVGGVGGGGSAGPDLALEQLRRDNALTNQVHDPAEDEPHIVGIPKRFLIADDEPPTPPHS